jgi:transcriptional regulator with XRE-family HTH domain
MGGSNSRFSKLLNHSVAGQAGQRSINHHEPDRVSASDSASLQHHLQTEFSYGIEAQFEEMPMSIPTLVLKRAREDSGLKQSAMAERLSVSGSVISRLERSETTDETMARRYLEAVNTPGSRDILDFYGRDWRLSERPTVLHPDREALWAAELALQRLEAFEQSAEYDALLASPLSLIRTNLLSSASFLGQTDHAMAWIGTVGVGKTTALSNLTNLMIPGKNGIPQPVFPASGGRTTTSEVVIRIAPAYGIAVEPKSEDEVRLLVTEMVRASADNKGGISTELDRAIRNMADLKKQKNPEDIRNQIDPIAAMIISARGVQDDVVEEIINRMRLGERTETQLILSETNEDGLKWLSTNITAINFGQDSRFSIPQRVTVFVPESAVRRSPYELSIIDTKGMHVTTERSDLQALTNDPRTLTVLCCGFNDAPGADPLKLLKRIMELGSDAIERHRVVLLVLPQGDQAMKIIDDSGDPPDSVEHGYAMRAAQVEDSLVEAGIGRLPVLFFNAIEDSAAKVWGQLNDQVGIIRQYQVERLSRFVALSEDLVTNADAARIQQARVAIEAEALAMAKAYGKLPSSARPAHQTLINEIKAGHPSSIAASITRRGAWDSFEIHHMIGTGVRTDANRRSNDHMLKMTGRLEGLEERFANLPEVKGLLETLREDIADWRQEFLSRALSIGRNTFKPYLDGSVEFWSDLGARYGLGKGYRDDISDMVENWFESTPELDDARKRVDARLGDAWDELVINRLVEATAVGEAA